MNAQIATGHVMRCLSIADALKKIGVRSVFISADDIPAELVKSRGYEIRVLGTDWNNMEEETDRLLIVTDTDSEDKNSSKPVLFVDSYQVTADYFRKTGEHFFTIYTDDMMDTAYPVDMLLCYAVYAKRDAFEELYKKADIRLPKLLTGTDYAPMRDMFAGCGKHVIRDNIENILIMTGGTDKYNMLDALLEKIAAENPEVDFTAICGLLYPGREILIRKYADADNIHIIAPVNNIRDYYEQADVVITAGGTTLYELCAVGTPAITFSFADNQLLNVITFDKIKVMGYAGDARTENVPENAAVLIKKYSNISKRTEISETEQKIIDGRGAERIAAELLNLL